MYVVLVAVIAVAVTNGIVYTCAIVVAYDKQQRLAQEQYSMEQVRNESTPPVANGSGQQDFIRSED